MSFARDYSLKEAEENCDLIVEGDLAFKYEDFIPGIAPLQRREHRLFDFNSVTVIKPSIQQAREQYVFRAAGDRRPGQSGAVLE